MKASLKFQEDQKPPILRLKVPLNILGFPFQSGVSACGDSKDLSLNLTTFFESGPSLKLVYKPNDSWNPFSLVVKTGIGAFGSPISAPLSMSAEFNLLERGKNPRFFLKFSPQFGDFGFKKSAGSELIKKTDLDMKPLENGVNGIGNGVSHVVDGVFNGVEVSAKTLLPIRNKAILKFNWGVRIPEELKSDVINGGFRNRLGGISLSKIPFLVMNKISIEHVAKDDKKRKSDDLAGEVEEVCVGVKRQLDVLCVENGLLRRAVEELRSEIGGANVGTLDSARCVRGKSGGGGEMRAAEFNGFAGKVMDADVNEEVTKGSTGIAGTGK